MVIMLSFKLLKVIPNHKRIQFFSSSNDSFSAISDILFARPIGINKTVKGWVKSLRKMGKVVFLDLNDGSSLNSLQIVISKEIIKKNIHWGSSVVVKGNIETNLNGQLELRAEKLDLIGKCDITGDFPFTPKQKQSYDLYRQYLHLRPKVEYFRCLLRFRSAAIFKIHQYFQENGFIQIHTPIITSIDCEGGGETFIIRPESSELIKAMKKKQVSDDNVFFDSAAYLTVSGQLHLEAVVRNITKVYSFSPSFRAENSKSRLHLSEFYMIEVEEAFISHLKSILERIENCVKEIVSYLLNKHLNEMEFLLHHNETDFKSHMKMLDNIICKPFSIITFSQAKAILHENAHKVKHSMTSPYNLTKEEELFLVKNNDDVPVFVTEWPKCEKPFYMKKSTENKDFVQGVDLLVPNVGELCGGSLREDNYDELKKELIKMKNFESLLWYLDLRKFGNVPSGGFGIGFERFLQLLLNIHNIKDTIPFPRWPHGLQL